MSLANKKEEGKRGQICGCEVTAASQVAARRLRGKRQLGQGTRAGRVTSAAAAATGGREISYFIHKAIVCPFAFVHWRAVAARDGGASASRPSKVSLNDTQDD